jgi:putative Mg2+ transporter-C (MgtC) family protein
MLGAMGHDLALFGRIALAAALGFLVGWEREARGQPAGDRTFTLVALGSAALTTLSVDAWPNTSEKLIAGIVTGVGFIGAGVVLRTPAGELRGLTTAAAIWAVAAVGVLAGAHRMVLATLSTVLVLAVLELRHVPGLRVLDARRYTRRFRSDSAPPPAHHRHGDGADHP